jgi:long-chain fatty acid transport protein
MAARGARRVAASWTHRAGRQRRLAGLSAGAALVLIGAFLPLQAHASGGASAVEQGTRHNGVANAGQAASANDATTAFFNPAGMTRLDRSQVAVGTQFVKVEVEFDADAATKAALGDNDGGDAGGYAAGLSSYYVHDLSDEWKLGASLTAPIAGGLDYDNQWVGRYFVTEVTSLALAFNPVAAYRVTDQFSVGAGAILSYMTMDFDLRLPTNVPPDGKLKLEDMDDWAVGWNLGVLFEPVEEARIGIQYRSEIEFDLVGSSRPSRLAPPFSNLLGGRIQSKFKIPQMVIASAYQQVTPDLALLLDVQWTDWSVFEDTPLDFAGLPVTLSIPRDWQDTWRYAIGMEYQATDRWLLQFGFSYDSSPTKHRGDRLPDLPIDRIFKYTVGAIYDWSENLTVGASFMYVDLGRDQARLDYTTGAGTVSGKYDRNDAFVLSLHLNWKMGE